jgi:NAD-dependent SIR2 family protein deacetylase
MRFTKKYLGAGISAPSGLPTFRGDGGIYTKEAQGGEDHPEMLLTQRYF